MTEEKTILYFVYEPIDEDPPCVSQVCILRDLGYSVHVLMKQCHPPMQKLFQEKGISWETFDVEPGYGGVFYKTRKYMSLQRHLRGMFRARWNRNTVFWIGSDRTAVVPGQRRKLRKHHPMVLSCLEYYEDSEWQGIMGKIGRSADVLLACERHRAECMKKAWGLDRLPYVLPNKPYHLDAFREMKPTTPETGKAVGILQSYRKRGMKILIYQGLVSEERDLSLLAEALKQSRLNVILAIMGPESPEGFSDRIKAIYPETIYLGRFYYPQHLEISSYADIGVAYYKGDTLNSRYCAPNKIYEYGCLGLPMLCSAVPGLTDTVGKAGAAECVEFGDARAVKAALERIGANYKEYSRAARAFYEATDNATTVRRAAEEAFSRTAGQQKV